MPRLSDLRQRYQASHHEELGMTSDAESLIFDSRSGLTPNQIVERKFGTALMREYGQREAGATTLHSIPR